MKVRGMITRDRYGLFLSFACFVAMGITSGLLGVAWPFIRATFGLSLDALVALLASTTIGYVLGSVLASQFLGRVGIGWVLLIANLAAVAGNAGYALAPGWGMLVALGLLNGWAGGTMGTALNIYVAASKTVRTMNWMHASFGIGASIGPLIMTTIVAAGLSWRLGYGVAALVYLALVIVAAAILSTLTFRGGHRGAATTGDAAPPPSIAATLRLPMVWVGIVLFVLYTGVETTTSQWTFTWFTEARAASTYLAGTLTSIFWAMLTVGRVVFGAGATRIGIDRLLRLSMAGVLLSAMLLLPRSLPLGFVAIALMGLSLSAIFPTLTADTPQRVGAHHAANAIGLQTAAASVGLALLPGLAGAVAERAGLEALAPFLVVSSLLMLLVNQGVLLLLRRQRTALVVDTAGD